LLIPKIEKILDKFFVKYSKIQLEKYSNYFYKSSKKYSGIKKTLLVYISTSIKLRLSDDAYTE